MKKKIITILTGAGISKESGIETFRDSNGLWNNYNVDDVATPRGWLANPELVLQFYNERRRQIKEAEPNEAHKQLVRLEDKFDVNIVTQNIDDLHERAGSKKILHIHGEIVKAKSSSGNEDMITHIGYEDIKIGDLCEQGFQMRPHVVWFGESVPMLPTAEGLAFDSDIFIIIGTSLAVYPAAGLARFTHSNVPIFIVDPGEINFVGRGQVVTHIKKNATEGVKELVEKLLSDEF